MSKAVWLIGLVFIIIGFVGAILPLLAYSKPPYDEMVYLNATILSVRFWGFAFLATIGAFMTSKGSKN